jgi:hypothetical protein
LALHLTIPMLSQVDYRGEGGLNGGRIVVQVADFPAVFFFIWL